MLMEETLARIAQIRQDIPVESVRNAIKQTQDMRFRIRLMIIEKLLSEPDLSLQNIAELLIVNRETVAKCLSLFNDGGLKALMPKRAGRSDGNPKYCSHIFSELVRTMKQEEEQWSLAQMQAFIKQRFSVHVPESTIYYRLKKMTTSLVASSRVPHSFRASSA